MENPELQQKVDELYVESDCLVFQSFNKVIEEERKRREMLAFWQQVHKDAITAVTYAAEQIKKFS